jgi:hypothetical protein
MSFTRILVLWSCKNGMSFTRILVVLWSCKNGMSFTRILVLWSCKNGKVGNCKLVTLRKIRLNWFKDDVVVG